MGNVTGMGDVTKMDHLTGTVPLRMGGETLLLHPERAVIWPRAAAVIVADIHFGKSSTFGRHGLAVPAGSDREDCARLSRLVESSGSRRLIILGDFLHEPLRAESTEANELETWSSSLLDSGVTIQVIAGNHDRGVNTGWRGSLEWIEGERWEPPFRFLHDSSRSEASADGAFSLSGHVHPVMALRGLRKRIARVPAFWQHAHGLVLPSFGSFTGGCLVSPAPGDRIFAVSREGVVPFPANGSATRG
jgi:DNA ligase-associated metallophosphoesterase